MCGFFVQYNFEDQKISNKQFIEASNKISHRGPDNNGFYYDNRIKLRFFRLSIIDLSDNANQPMFSRSRRYIIVFNGEIYNFRDLINKLPKKKNLNLNSDTEVLVNLYEIYGEKIVKFIKGMFSLIIYDKLKKKIFVLRDRFGIKPLYYYKNDKSIFFSSEIKPLLSYTNQTSDKFDEHSLASFFFKQEMDIEKTFFKNVKILKPGYFLKIENRNFQFTNYWNIFRSHNRDLSNKKDIIKKLDDLLKNSLKQHLVSDAKVSLLLSSGLDSSILAYLIKKYYNKSINTFTYDFENSTNGEANRAKEISNYLGFNNKSVFINSKYIINNFNNIILELESPFTSIRLFGLRKVFNEISKTGNKVAIEGSGGDEILGGYSYNFYSSFLDKKKNIDLVKILKKKNSEEITNIIMTLSYQNGSTKDSVPFINTNFFNKDFLIRNLDENFFLKNYNNKRLNKLQQSQIVDINNVNLPRSLKYMDRLAMNSHIENRVPFLDHNLASYCFNLPNKFKINKNETRYIMKEVFKKYQIYRFFTKKKKSIVDPQRSWLGNELYSFFMDEIRSQKTYSNEIFNYGEIEKSLNLSKKNQLRNSFQLFQILTTIFFIKNFQKKI